MHINNTEALRKVIEYLPKSQLIKQNAEPRRLMLLERLAKHIKINHPDEESRAFSLFLKRLVDLESYKKQLTYGIVPVHLGPGNVPINAIPWAATRCGNNITRISLSLANK